MTSCLCPIVTLRLLVTIVIKTADPQSQQEEQKEERHRLFLEPLSLHNTANK